MNGDSQLTFTCSKSRTEAVEKSVKYVRSDVVLVFLLLTLNMFHTFFSAVSTIDFEQVNVSSVDSTKRKINESQ